MNNQVSRRCGEPIERVDSDSCPDLDQHDYFTGGPLEGYVLPLSADGANIIDEIGQTVTETDSDQHATFIVRAVNAHDEMLEALKQLANVTNQKGMDRTVVASIVAQARQAIAKAESK